jgi:hypothetical protein
MSFNIFIRATCLARTDARTPIAQMKIPCDGIHKERPQVDIPVNVARIPIRVRCHQLADAGGAAGTVRTVKRIASMSKNATVFKMTS